MPSKPSRSIGSRARSSRRISCPRDVLLLQRDVVVVGEAVEADDVVTLGAERLGEVRADEAGGAGDEVAHQAVSGRSSPPSSTRQTSE